MTAWLPAAILSLFSFGLWGLFTKLAITYIDSKSALIYQSVGVFVVTFIALSFVNFKPAFDMKGLTFAVLTGIFYTVGLLFYFYAADKGKIITVVTLTALYPLVTIFLAYFILKEAITIKQYIGIGLACIAILLMSV